MSDEEIIRKAINEACELMLWERCGSQKEREDTERERVERHEALTRIIEKADSQEKPIL